ncbi:nesprin-4 isoform X3 [Suricata suricatta]|uniref:nesprin-4 isoform X3 n=1 Tax=Suricata suricatta TaxID=37032 RepID=UPI001155AC0E|nr:nesprin-4 isoform X3 [Suricata suricatta]
MVLPPPLGPRLPSEPLSHPPGAPRELDIAGCTICPASGEKRIRPEEAQKLGQDSLDPPEHFQGGLRGTEPAAGALRWPAPTSRDDPAGGRHREHLISGQEVLEAEQDSLSLRLLGLGLRLQDLEQGLAPWASAQSGMVQLQVFEEANTLDQDLEVEGDLDGPGPGGAWGPWAPSSLPTPAELEWDPAGDVGGLRPLGRKTAWIPGAPCELCGHRIPQGRGQGLEDMLMSGFSHRKHLACQRRCSLLQKPQDKKQASPNLQEVMLESPSSCIQGVPGLLPSLPSLCSPHGCHTAPATVGGVLLVSCPIGQDTLPGAQLCQWSPPSLSTWPRHM